MVSLPYLFLCSDDFRKRGELVGGFKFKGLLAHQKATTLPHTAEAHALTGHWQRGWQAGPISKSGFIFSWLEHQNLVMAGFKGEEE
jgi:hypothetical protein